jgi:3-oxoacyl-[acyl-carrier protein] reductase
MINLSGKVALITGGSRGIGAAAAAMLAQAGCNIAITYTSSRAKALMTRDRIALLGRQCLVLKVNVSSQPEVRRALRTTIRHFGRIDILVNNAGIWKYGAIGSMTPQQWDETLDVNLKGVFLFCNEITRYMKRRGGKIINIASTAGQRGEAFHSHYAASKAGVIAFTKSIASELAPYGINVNCVAPGWVETDMSKGVMSSKKTRKKIEESIPRGRVASPEEIAGPILFLASELSNHLVGTTLSVSGGGVMVP